MATNFRQNVNLNGNKIYNVGKVGFDSLELLPSGDRLMVSNTLLQQAQQLAFLSDIPSGGGGGTAPLPQNTAFVAPNFTQNSGGYYSSLTAAYNAVSSNGAIIMYSGTYDFPLNITKNVDFIGMGSVTINPTGEVNINNSVVRIYNGEIKLNMPNNNYSFKTFNSVITLKLNNFTGEALYFKNSITDVSAMYIYANIIYYHDTTYHYWHLLNSKRIGDGTTSSPAIRINTNSGYPNRIHCGLEALFFYGTRDFAAGIDLKDKLGV